MTTFTPADPAIVAKAIEMATERRLAYEAVAGHLPPWMVASRELTAEEKAELAAGAAGPIVAIDLGQPGADETRVVISRMINGAMTVLEVMTEEEARNRLFLEPRMVAVLAASGFTVSVAPAARPAPPASFRRRFSDRHYIALTNGEDLEP